MKTPLQQFRDDYLETLLRFVWREWTALGVAGQERGALSHVADPEALLLFTCSLGRYDQRLFDEVMDWLVKNGRFLNVQRLRNVMRREVFGGSEVLSAIADWLAQRENPMKWKLLARMDEPKGEHESLFYLPDGRPLPHITEHDATFREHGFIRNPVANRGYAQPFPGDAASCRLLQMRALFGVNARCDVLMYLALNATGHPREVARELYYSQKTIHDVMTDMACSGLVQSSRGARERTFRIVADSLSFLTCGLDTPSWTNWPILLSTAESVWRLANGLCSANLDSLVQSSEITLTMKPLLERLARARWAPAIPVPPGQEGLAQLESFQVAFENAIA